MTEHTTEGRRRSDTHTASFPGHVPTGPGATVTQANRGPSAIDEAFMVVDDRQSRLDHALDELEQMLGRLADRLTAALTDGQPAPYPGAPPDGPMPATPEDRRSTIARRLAGTGVRADQQADRVTGASMRVGSILDALEV